MGIKTLRRYNDIKTARVQINIKGYNDADKNKGGLLPDSFLLPPILNNRKIQNATTITLRRDWVALIRPGAVEIKHV